MASGTADLQRDLGGALMTSIFGALLTAGYATAMAGVDSSTTESTQATLQLSYSSAEDLAASTGPGEPDHGGRPIVVPQGRPWAYLAAMIAILIGMGLVFRFFPKKDAENALRAEYHAQGHGSRAGRRAADEVRVPAPGAGPAVVPGHVSSPEELE